jgi:hypothetical protein
LATWSAIQNNRPKALDVVTPESPPLAFIPEIMEAIMAPISAQRLTFTFVPPRLGLTATLWEILTLRQKLADPDSQSWYFRKGLASNQQRLHELSETYEKERWEFNRIDSDQYLELKAMVEHELEYVIPHQRPFFLRAIFQSRAEQQLNDFKEALILKSRIDTLYSAEYYENHPDALLMLLGDWETFDGEV